MSDTGYIYAVICAIMMVMQTMVAGACIERLLTGRDDRISKRKRAVMFLIENGKTDEAGEVIKDLSERISKTQE